MPSVRRSRRSLVAAALVMVALGAAVTVTVLRHNGAGTPNGALSTSRALNGRTGTAMPPSFLPNLPSASPSGSAANPLHRQLPTAIGGCSVSPILVNGCRAWLGAAARDYPGKSGSKANILAHEEVIGRPVDIAHTYHPPGSSLPNDTDLYFLDRPNTILLTNWKPASTFADAAGGNAAVDAKIHKTARSVKAAGRTFMLALWHEPENDVSRGTACGGLIGHGGSPAEYVAMWRHVRSIFTAEGVTNVVWVMNYMGASNWDCLVPSLWPGNDLVDWVMYDPYSSGGNRTWASQVGRFYSYLLSHSDGTHDFLSKPWGLGEFGIGHSPDGSTVASQAQSYTYYDDAVRSIRTNMFPRLKAYVDFDVQGVHDTKIAYSTITHRFDQTELEHYSVFAATVQSTRIG
jgi:hypothetical protein